MDCHVSSRRVSSCGNASHEFRRSRFKLGLVWMKCWLKTCLQTADTSTFARVICVPYWHSYVSRTGLSCREVELKTAFQAKTWSFPNSHQDVVVPKHPSRVQVIHFLHWLICCSITEIREEKLQRSTCKGPPEGPLSSAWPNYQTIPYAAMPAESIKPLVPDVYLGLHQVVPTHRY